MSFKLDKHLIPLPLDRTKHIIMGTCWLGDPNIAMPVELYLWLEHLQSVEGVFDVATQIISTDHTNCFLDFLLVALATG